MTMFQLPAVQDLLHKRAAYRTAKEEVFRQVLSEPAVYVTPAETLTSWLDFCIGDAELQAELLASISQGPPRIHWGEEEAACHPAQTVAWWQLRNVFSEEVTCPDCRAVRARAR